MDLTLGLGWGRLGGRNHISNPFGWLSDSYKTRGGSTTFGGTLNLGRLFSGENASFFGGLEYYTPIPNLSVKLEYDPSDYSRVLGKEKIFDWSLRYDNWKLDKARSQLICSKISGTAKSDFAAKEMYKTCMKDRKNRGHY